MIDSTAMLKFVRASTLHKIDAARVRIRQIKKRGYHPHICAYSPRIAAAIASSV